jgi:hypothetical protein
MPPIRSRTSTTHTDHSKYLKSNSNSYKNTSWNHHIPTDTTSYIPTLPFATTQRLNTSKHENNSTIYKHCSYITIPIIYYPHWWLANLPPWTTARLYYCGTTLYTHQSALLQSTSCLSPPHRTQPILRKMTTRIEFTHRIATRTKIKIQVIKKISQRKYEKNMLNKIGHMLIWA